MCDCKPRVLSKSFRIAADRQNSDEREAVVRHVFAEMGEMLVSKMAEAPEQEKLVKLQFGWKAVKHEAADDFTARLVLADPNKITTQDIRQTPALRNFTQQQTLSLALYNPILHKVIECGAQSGETWEETLVKAIKCLLLENEQLFNEVVKAKRAEGA